MLRLKNVSKSFEGKPVLRDVSFDFPEAAVTAVTGPSGSGKTTLANLLLGLIPPDAGEIKGLEGLKPAAVFQEDRLVEHWDAFRNVRLTARKGVSDETIRRALAEVGLDARERQRVAKYSGGMKRRVAIVRAVLSRPDLLVLDEPFKGLDEAVRADCAAFILRECSGATILLITHDPDEAALMGAAAELSLGAGEARPQ